MTTTRIKTPLELAQDAADSAFDAYLTKHAATAAVRVPDGVIAAATKAYRDAYGEGEIEVVGHGNRTHPVCSVTVRRKK